MLSLSYKINLIYLVLLCKVYFTYLDVSVCTCVSVYVYVEVCGGVCVCV